MLTFLAVAKVVNNNTSEPDAAYYETSRLINAQSMEVAKIIAGAYFVDQILPDGTTEICPFRNENLDAHVLSWEVYQPLTA